MTFIQTISAEQATDTLQEMYAADIKSLGYIANYTKAMSLRPEAIAAYRNLVIAVRSNMRMRRYVLVVLATALTLRCTY